MWFELRADLRNAIGAGCRARDGAGMMTTKKGMYPFVDAVRERSYLAGLGLTTILIFVKMILFTDLQK